MVAGFHHAGHGGEHRGHAGRGRAAIWRALDQPHTFLEHVDGGIAEARIDEAVDAVLERVLGLLGGVIDIAGRREDRF